MRPLARKALDMLQGQGLIRVVNHDLLDATLKEIEREYKPGLIGWIKYDSDRWREFLALEDNINRTTLSGNEEELRSALEDYRGFMLKMVEQFEAAETLPLFKRGSKP